MVAGALPGAALLLQGVRTQAEQGFLWAEEAEIRSPGSGRGWDLRGGVSEKKDLHGNPDVCIGTDRGFVAENTAARPQAEHPRGLARASCCGPENRTETPQVRSAEDILAQAGSRTFEDAVQTRERRCLESESLELGPF